MDANAKKALIYFGIFTGVVGVLILVLNLVFKRPNHHDEARWGQVHIQLADGPEGFSQHHRQVAQEALPELNRLGPTFVLGGEGSNAVRVVNVDLTNGHPGQCPDKGAARYVTNTLTGDSHIEIDPTCTHGDLEFRTALMHEVGHALGMQHICGVSERRNDCSPVGRGVAVMNTSLVVDNGEQPGDVGADGEQHVYTGPIPCFEVQGLDVQEFERVARPGQHLIRPLNVR
jgi:hypothetical protein